MNDVRKTIGWADYTWNPIVGCKGGCDYCYARKFARRQKCELCKTFVPHYHPDRLYDIHGGQKPARIFCGSMTDFWGNGVEQFWRDRVYEAMELCPQHTFYLLTKQPQNIADADLIPDNCWVGVSITGPKDLWRLVDLDIKTLQTERSFVSIEPLLEPIENMSFFCHLGWCIIGGLRPKPVHKKVWVDSIMQEARDAGAPIFLKTNLHYPDKIQEWPE